MIANATIAVGVLLHDLDSTGAVRRAPVGTQTRPQLLVPQGPSMGGSPAQRPEESENSKPSCRNTATHASTTSASKRVPLPEEIS